MSGLYEQDLTRAELLNLAEETLRQIDAPAAVRAQVISALHAPPAGACTCPAGPWTDTDADLYCHRCGWPIVGPE